VDLLYIKNNALVGKNTGLPLTFAKKWKRVLISPLTLMSGTRIIKFKVNMTVVIDFHQQASKNERLTKSY
jgi:hypothetical protein